MPPLLCLLACGPSAGSGEASGSGTDGGSTQDPSETGASSGSSTGTESSTGGTTVGPTSTSEGESTGEELCPPRQEVETSFELVPGDESVDATCAVVDHAYGDPERYTLECDEKSYELTIPLLVDNALFSEQVRVRYEVDQPFWTNRWLSISDPETGLLRIGAVSASSMYPPGDPTDFFADVAIDASVSECEAVPSDCATERRIALGFHADISFPDDEELDRDIVDGNAFVHDFNHVHYANVSVGTAVEYGEPISCTDLPGSWYEFVFLRGVYPD
jgi:hypothetical protein